MVIAVNLSSGAGESRPPRQVTPPSARKPQVWLAAALSALKGGMGVGVGIGVLVAVGVRVAVAVGVMVGV